MKVSDNLVQSAVRVIDQYDVLTMQGKIPVEPLLDEAVTDLRRHLVAVGFDPALKQTPPRTTHAKRSEDA